MSFIDTTVFRRFAADKLKKNNLFETKDLFCDLYCLEPGQGQRPHAHADATKFYFVIEGTGDFLIGVRRERLGPGGLAFSVPGEIHGVENPGPGRLVLMVVMGPNPNLSA